MKKAAALLLLTFVFISVFAQDFSPIKNAAKQYAPLIEKLNSQNGVGLSTGQFAAMKSIESTIGNEYSKLCSYYGIDVNNKLKEHLTLSRECNLLCAILYALCVNGCGIEYPSNSCATNCNFAHSGCITGCGAIPHIAGKK
jgi:hypothetical protein